MCMYGILGGNFYFDQNLENIQILVVLDLFFFQMFIGIYIKCCEILCMYLDRKEDFGILYVKLIN